MPHTSFRLIIAFCVTSCASSAPPQTSKVEVKPVPPADTFTHLEELSPYRSFGERKQSFHTKLSPLAPSKGQTMPHPPQGVSLQNYPSGDLMLKAWYAAPNVSPQGAPAVLFLHNDFSMPDYTYDNSKPFVDAGFFVMMPTVRGENGNPGHMELLLGEVDDAAAAVRWLAAQPGVDKNFIYVIGHSIGGGIAAMLSLYPNLPIRRCASVGGIYRARAFQSWSRRKSGIPLIRFDPNDLSEVSMRILEPNLRDMKHPLIAYAAKGNYFDRSYARHVAEKAKAYHVPFLHIPVNGEHMSSITPAVLHFIETIRVDYAFAHPSN